MYIKKPADKGAGKMPNRPFRNLDEQDMNGTSMGQRRHWFFKNRRAR